MEAAPIEESHSRGAKPERRRTDQIPSSRREAKKTTLIPLRSSPYYSRAQIPSRRPGLNDASKKQLCAGDRAQIPSRRGCLDDDDSKKQLRAFSRAQVSSLGGVLLDDSNRQGHPNWVTRTKRRRFCVVPPPDNKKRGRDLVNRDEDGCFSGLIDLPCPPDNNSWRDWSDLGDGPAGLIAERVLSYDVADYVRFRSVCRPWRQCSTEPRSHSGLDRRFHPWRWTMLREKLATPDRRCFLNTSTGQCVQVDIPELHDHELLAVTPEGLLVLVHDRKHMCLLNPLTRQLTELPPLSTLLPPEYHDRLSGDNSQFCMDFTGSVAGIANDDSTFVLCFSRLGLIGMTKPGDDHWTFLKFLCGATGTPLMFAGTFYCVTLDGLMVLDTGADQTPRLEVAAEIHMHLSSMSDRVHLVNNCGELMLVHSCCRLLAAQRELVRCYDVYRVDLNTGSLSPVKSLGGGAGRAVFMGMHRSLSVSLDAFPSGSISADTIYVRSDANLKARAYHLVDGSSEGIKRYTGSLSARPHTLVDSLSLAVTV